MKLKNFSVAVFFLILFAGECLAAPTVIRDSRIWDTGLTPVLGRGYSIVSNTFQSTCLLPELTTPSFDFTYKFQSVENGDRPTMNKLKKYGLDMDENPSNQQGTNTFYIYVEINMDTYYGSVDEAKSVLSESAKTLLEHKDMYGFFSSCGTNYVRSLGRNAKFIALFEYSQSSPERDQKFEKSLENAIKKFGKGDEAGIFSNDESNLSGQIASKNLTITAAAFGLGKNVDADLISYDIDTFKASIKQAFKAMQNPTTGKVTTMEVVPWVENTEFQNAVFEPTYQSAANENAEKNSPNQNSSALFKQKEIVKANAEFMAEIERANRNKTNIYYKAKLCKIKFEGLYGAVGGNNNQFAFSGEFVGAKVLHLKRPTNEFLKIDIETFYKDHLATEKVEDLLSQQILFMYGSADGSVTGGASKCLEDIMDTGINKEYYFKHASCQKIKQDILAATPYVIDNYCMPVVEVKYKKEGGTKKPAAGN